MVRKANTEGIPYGRHRQTGKLVSINEVARGLACDCVCPGCGTELVAKQGDVNLWHFAHSTDVAGECNGLMASIRAKVREVIMNGSKMAIPHLLAGKPGGRISFTDLEQDMQICNANADLVGQVGDTRVAVFLDEDRTLKEQLLVEHLHASEKIALLRIDLLDLEYLLSRAQKSEDSTNYTAVIEQTILNNTECREWVYHPLVQQTPTSDLHHYAGREPGDPGRLQTRLHDHTIKLPGRLPASVNATIELQRDIIVALSRLTVRASDIAQTDELPSFLRYFRQNCLEGSDRVSAQFLDTWSGLVTDSNAGAELTSEERHFLEEVEHIARFCLRLQASNPCGEQQLSMRVVPENPGTGELF